MPVRQNILAMPVQLRTEQTATRAFQSDEDLMVRVQAGDAQAFDLLFDRYGRVVFSIGNRILRDFGEAQDLVQDTFLYVFRSARIFDPAKGRAGSWIVRAAYHRALNRREYLANRCFYTDTTSASLADIVCGDTDLDRDIAATLDRRQLEKAFMDLSEKQRRTLELYFFEGLELKEISERLDESLGNVRHHYYRGLENLRKGAIVKAIRGK